MTVPLLVSLFALSARAATLDEALRAAEDNSVDLQLIAARTADTRTLPGQAWSTLSPKLIAGGNYTLNEHATTMDPSVFIPASMQDLFPPGDPIVIQPKHAWQGSLTVQQTLFSGSAVPGLIGAYRIVDAAEADERSARDQVRLGVVMAYYGLYAAREGEALAEQAEATAKDELALAQKRLSAETTTPRAVLQGELRLSQAGRDITKAHEQRVSAEESFAQLTGLPRDTPLELPPPPPVPATLEDAIAQAQGGQPALEAADARVAASKMMARANAAGWAPEVTGRFTQAYTPDQGLFGAADNTPWMIVVEGQWVLWDGGYRLAKSREYAVQTHMAGLARDKAGITAESDVRTAWEGYHRASAAVDAVTHEQELAEASLDLAKRGFEAEQVTWLEVEQADLGVRAAKLDAVVERMNRDVAAYRLLVATGGW